MTGKHRTITEDNHYVPQSLLGRWADPAGRVWSYRVLVSRAEVPLWKPTSPRGIAYHKHLYTRSITSGETDDIERWFEQEFESPAAEPIERAVSGKALTPADWAKLIRFVGAQHVRTPARLVESLRRWEKELPETVQSSLEDTVRALKSAKHDGTKIDPLPHQAAEHFPARVTIEHHPGDAEARIRVNTFAGRGLWLFAIKHLLTHTITALQRHRWTILRSPEGFDWATSDDPVICLNYHTEHKYDFGGGWGSKGTEIFLPLSPNHIMYTQIGERSPRRGQVLDLDKAKMFQRFIVEHAHRLVFARTQDQQAESLRPRIVDENAFLSEAREWKQWHTSQSSAERELLGPGPEPWRQEILGD